MSAFRVCRPWSAVVLQVLSSKSLLFLFVAVSTSSLCERAESLLSIVFILPLLLQSPLRSLSVLCVLCARTSDTSRVARMPLVKFSVLSMVPVLTVLFVVVYRLRRSSVLCSVLLDSWVSSVVLLLPKLTPLRFVTQPSSFMTLPGRTWWNEKCR